MKVKISLFTGILFIISFLLIGCATSSYTSGVDFDSTKIEEIKKGETTKDEIVKWFGEPYTKSVMPENQETWIFMYIEGSATAQSFLITTKVNSSNNMKKLDIIFKDDVVENYTYSNGGMPTTFQTK